MKESDESLRPVGIGAHLERIAELGDWRGETLSRNAQAHQESRPGRRRGVEVDGHSDLVALIGNPLQTGESYKNVVKLTLQGGRSLQDPAHSSLESRRKRTPRDRTSHEGEEVDESAFKRSFAKRSPSTVLASRNLRRRKS